MKRRLFWLVGPAENTLLAVSCRHTFTHCGTPPTALIAVENATSTSGLAAATAVRLKAAGYNVDTKNGIGNAPGAATTTVYYRTGADRTAALCVRKKFFRGSALARLPSTSGIPAADRVAVFLGADYAAKQPNG